MTPLVWRKKTLFLRDFYVMRPLFWLSTIAQESQQSASRGRVLAFFRIAPCLSWSWCFCLQEYEPIYLANYQARTSGERLNQGKESLHLFAIALSVHSYVPLHVVSASFQDQILQDLGVHL